MFPKETALLDNSVFMKKQNLSICLLKCSIKVYIKSVHISSSSAMTVIFASASAAAALFGKNFRALGFSWT